MNDLAFHGCPISCPTIMLSHVSNLPVNCSKQVFLNIPQLSQSVAPFQHVFYILEVSNLEWAYSQKQCCWWSQTLNIYSLHTVGYTVCQKELVKYLSKFGKRETIKNSFSLFFSLKRIYTLLRSNLKKLQKDAKNGKKPERTDPVW